MTIEAVVFDVGNVLIEWDPDRFYDAEIGEARRRELIAQTGLMELNNQLDLGLPFCETVYAHADAHPDWSDEIRMFHDRWIEICQPAIALSVHLMRALKRRGVPVFSLTNFGTDSYDLAATHYPFLREFDRDFISGHEKVMKPDGAFYEILENRSGLSGNQLVFADDREDNIAAAASRGWHTHLFTGPEGWADTLVGHGLLTEEEARLP